MFFTHHRLKFTTRQARGIAAIALLLLGSGGCGGGDSEAPNFTQEGGFAGTYSGTINRTASGAAVNTFLPSGTVTLQADSAGSLRVLVSVTDTSRAKASRAITTYTTADPVVGTYDNNGRFDISGRAREFDDRTGSFSFGQQTIRVQGILPSEGATSTLTVQVGEKTATGTLTVTNLGTPTPTPTASATTTPSSGPPAPPLSL